MLIRIRPKSIFLTLKKKYKVLLLISLLFSYVKQKCDLVFENVPYILAIRIREAEKKQIHTDPNPKHRYRFNVCGGPRL